eukprot:TRINITY_DN6822_c0_g2_i1.p1 TRINITY_DN6822_c0_g2~~TRINITY_DN6822_c0_g2_i1.p1  ORF type:complete len:499 (-),score=60.01 TRINITY_DN6822_c0_g2_i1:91-1551(-)
MHFRLLSAQLLLFIVTAQFPVPPEVTKVQQAVLAKKAGEARTASLAATNQVLELFDSEVFRAGLWKCCPTVAGLPSKELLQLYREEVRVAELAHTFPSGYGKGGFEDITIPLASHFTWFLNEWQAPLIGNGTVTGMYNLAEENIYGLPPFVNDSKPTWDEAADRLIYVAHNMRQIDTGSIPVYGDVTAVFRTSHVRDMVEIAAVDTGMFEVNCNQSVFPNRSKKRFVNVNCSGWKPTTVGTMKDFDHIIISNLRTFSLKSTSTVEEEAIKLFSRSAFAADYLNLPNVSLLDGLKYYEANILGNPRFPDAVSFLIGNFHTLFGTDAGRKLQLLADQYAWPLVWAFGAKLRTPWQREEGQNPTQNTRAAKKEMWESLHESFKLPSFPGNQRILDPETLSSHALNATISTDMKNAFANVWSQVAKQREGLVPIPHTQWQSWWSELSVSQARLAPLTARAGCSPDVCIGTMAVSGKCVCMQPKPIRTISI